MAFVAFRSLLPLLILDGLCFAIAVWAAFALRLNEWWPERLSTNWPLIPITMFLGCLSLYILKVYRAHLHHTNIHTIKRIAYASLLTVILSWLCWEKSGLESTYLPVPRSSWILLFILCIGSLSINRAFIRELLLKKRLKPHERQKALIYGAGTAGIALAKALMQSTEMKIVGFIDDNPKLQRHDINGLRVYNAAQIDHLIEKHNLHAILLAIPSLPANQRRQLINTLSTKKIKVLIMPSLAELASGSRTVDQLREVMIEDLLGRDPVPPFEHLLQHCIQNKVVLVTGAGGSIGSELCRQIIQQSPHILILVERSEFALYTILQELERVCHKQAFATQMIPLLCSVTDSKKLSLIFQRFKPQTVYHAAAYKHVPLVEHNIIAGVENNVLGTLYCALAAAQYGCENFVLISTDKAVRPTNIMGASKRCAELILQTFAQTSTIQWHNETISHHCKFSMVRFGNVLASSGSVVPLFKQQIAAGGPITVTHPEVVRYFMMIPEAAQLVLQAAGMSQGGEVFLLDMGEPVKIVELAYKMIELSGLRLKTETQAGDIAITFTGLRPGEKLYEELLIEGEPSPTQHPMIFRTHDNAISPEYFYTALTTLIYAIEHFDVTTIDSIFKEIVEGYERTSTTHDYLSNDTTLKYNMPHDHTHRI